MNNFSQGGILFNWYQVIFNSNAISCCNILIIRSSISVQIDIKSMMYQNLLFWREIDNPGFCPTQDFVEVNIPDFITIDQWPANSPDLNSLDYSIWDSLKKLVYVQENNVHNIPSLRTVIVHGWKSLSQCEGHYLMHGQSD